MVTVLLFFFLSTIFFVLLIIVCEIIAIQLPDTSRFKKIWRKNFINEISDDEDI